MGILKVYGHKVGISGKTGEVQMPDFAGQSMRDIGSVAMGISKDYLNRKADAKLSADKADYETSLITLNGQIEQKMNDAMAGGMSYKDVHDKVVAPEVDRFKSNLQNQGFSEAGNSYAQNNFKTDGGKIIAGSIGFREKRELEEINESNKRGYYAAKDSGDDGLANEYLGKIQNMAGSKIANDTKSKYLYNSFALEMQSLEELVLNGDITDKEYMAEMSSVRSKIKDSEIMAEHEKPLLTQATAKMNSYTRKKQQSQSSAISEFKRLDRSGDLGGAELEKLERVMGADYSETLLKLNYDSMKKGAVDDTKLQESLALVNEFANTTDMDFYKTIKKTEKIGGKAGKRAFWQISEIYKERIDKDVEVGTPMASYRTDYFAQVSRFVSANDKSADWYDDRMMKFDKWIEKNPDANQDEYFDFRYKELKTDVAEFVGKITSPQIKTERTVSRTGTKNGRKIVQYSDGTIEYAD